MILRYTAPAALLLATGLHAQRIGTSRAPITFEVPGRTQSNLPIAPAAPVVSDDARGPGDVVFSEDFANGLDGNNGIGSWGVSGPDGAIWLFDTDGPNGDFSSTGERIQSATVNNGFMIFDSNFSNNGCTSCTSWDGSLVSPVLDLTATPYVHLRYTQRLRWCCNNDAPHFIDISLDGGNTWTVRIPATENQWTNNDPGTYTRYINLHNIISGNPETVAFRFAHDGATVASSTHYHWQIDDVQIVESAENDVELLRPRFASFLPDVSGTDELEFTIYPASQVRELSMGSPVQNEGSTTATNVMVNVEVLDPSNTSIFNEGATAASIPPNGTDSTLRVFFTPPTTPGEYTVEIDLTMDAEDDIPGDNSATRSFEIDPFIYAYDNGARDNFVRNVDDQNNALDFCAGNLFWIENEATAYGMQVALARAAGQNPGTDLNAIFDGVVFEVAEDGAFVEVGNTDIFEVTALNQLSSNGQAKWFNLPFLTPLEMQAGFEYVVAVRGYGGGEEVVVATSGRAESITSLLQRPYEEEPNWYILATRPMVRLSFDPSTGIADSDRQNGFGLGQNFPNPATATTTIPYDLSRTADVVIELHDLSGKVISRLGQGKRAPGAYRVELNTAGLNAGVYFYSLVAGDTRITKRLMVLTH
ncbi:MAG TPA: T9SS type A sorting domain-containing protein [Flavobacteriales bacterium]